MNDTSMVTMSTGPGRCARPQVARVHALDDEHARIVAQPPVELAVSHVERDDVPGATLQQHVGEAAGRRADVEAVAAPAPRCAKVSSACASFSPPRPTYG